MIQITVMDYDIGYGEYEGEIQGVSSEVEYLIVPEGLDPDQIKAAIRRTPAGYGREFHIGETMRIIQDVGVEFRSLSSYVTRHTLSNRYFRDAWSFAKDHFLAEKVITQTLHDQWVEESKES